MECAPADQTVRRGMPSSEDIATAAIAEREDRDPTHDVHQRSSEVLTDNSAIGKGSPLPVVGQSRAEPFKAAAQQLIESINTKRQRDSEIVADLRHSLEEEMNDKYIRVQQGLSEVYDKTSQSIQEKLEELFATLDRIGKLEMELQQVSKALGTLYADMQGQG